MRREREIRKGVWRGLPLNRDQAQTALDSRRIKTCIRAITAQRQAEVLFAPSPMSPSNPLQTLHNLDRTSPHFHNQLIDLLRGKEYRDATPTLKEGNLAWLVYYLDKVSLHNVSPHPALTAGTGPLRNLRFQQRPILGATRRAQEDL